ncbi:peroxin, partial [Ceratobasidium sp. 395]
MAAADALIHSEPILTRVLSELFKTDDPQIHALRLPLLAECGRAVHAATANVLFHTVALPDDDALFYCTDSENVSHLANSYVNGHQHPSLGQAGALVRNHARYAGRLRRLVVSDPVYSYGRSPKRENTLFELEAHDEDDEDEGAEEDGIRPISGARLEMLLKGCTKLEELMWVSSVPPPDWICETLAVYIPHLKRFTFSPSNSTTAPVLKWDAPSISHLPPLAHLGLSRLSQAGASALAANPPEARSLALDFVWLDDFVCERLARGSVRKLVIGTGGTKLTDRGIGALMDGCEALEELELVDVQGRLSKTLWANVELPLTLDSFKIAMSEGGPHHSWTADHLLSLPSLASLTQLSRISITRNLGTGLVDDVAVAKPVSHEMVRALAGCDQVEHLECDWWLWSVDELKELVEGCVSLQTLRVALDAPFAKLLTLTSSFAHLLHLARLYVTIPSAHAPSAPPSPTLNTPGLSPLALSNGYTIGGTYSAGGISIGPASIGSPTSSPLSLARSLKSPKLVMPLPLPTAGTNGDVMDSPVTPGGSLAMAQSFGAGNMNEQMETAGVDAVLPPLRDVRKFVRRCPKLVLLEWFGRTARGSWIAHREDAKSVASVKVEYVPPVIVDDDGLGGALSGINAGYGGHNIGLHPREGAEWTGTEAEAAAEAVRDYEAERDAEIEREKEAKRRRPS